MRTFGIHINSHILLEKRPRLAQGRLLSEAGNSLRNSLRKSVRKSVRKVIKKVIEKVIEKVIKKVIEKFIKKFIKKFITDSVRDGPTRSRPAPAGRGHFSNKKSDLLWLTKVRISYWKK